MYRIVVVLFVCSRIGRSGSGAVGKKSSDGKLMADFHEKKSAILVRYDIRVILQNLLQFTIFERYPN